MPCSSQTCEAFQSRKIIVFLTPNSPTGKTFGVKPPPIVDVSFEGSTLPTDGLSVLCKDLIVYISVTLAHHLYEVQVSSAGLEKVHVSNRLIHGIERHNVKGLIIP